MAKTTIYLSTTLIAFLQRSSSENYFLKRFVFGDSETKIAVDKASLDHGKDNQFTKMYENELLF